MRNAPKIAILMLTHNAPGYVFKSIWTLRRVTSSTVGYELIVVDNGSHLLKWNPDGVDFEDLKLLLIRNLKLMLTSCGNSDEKREVRSQIARYTVFGDGKCNR